MDFNKAVSAEIATIKPDLIFTTSTRVSHGEAPGRIHGSRLGRDAAGRGPGYTGCVREGHAKVPGHGARCLAQHADDEAACAIPRADAYPGESPASLPSVLNLDFSDYFCPGDTCPAVIGNTIAYLDDNHPTATYMKTLVPIFEERFLAATGWKEQ